VGKPLNCQLKILDAEGKDCPPGAVGEIYMKGAASGRDGFRYIGAPMPNVTADGFSTFGDLGWVDAEGFLFIADRRVDMIVTGGANVFPAEVEAALAEHPQIADAVVIGLPDAEWGRRVHAVIEPIDAASPPSAADLTKHCRSRLAPYKVPKSFEIIAKMPRSAAGKINRSALIDERAEH
jgi:bile acid-coenzyme A ligase